MGTCGTKPRESANRRGPGGTGCRQTCDSRQASGRVLRRLKAVNSFHEKPCRIGDMCGNPSHWIFRQTPASLMLQERALRSFWPSPQLRRSPGATSPAADDQATKRAPEVTCPAHPARGCRLVGGKASRQGVPQGGVISPLIANLYMNRFLKYWRQTGRGEAWKAHVINYADDFVILSRGHAAEALAWTDCTMNVLDTIYPGSVTMPIHHMVLFPTSTS